MHEVSLQPDSSARALQEMQTHGACLSTSNAALRNDN